jgi:cation:H+ antiporter
MLIQVLIFVVSLFVLIKGSDWFIGAAERIGLSLGIPSFIIGVTIVAFGTSLPELATSIIGVLAGQSDIVVGNVVGSNITNILLVVGAVAIFTRRVPLRANIMDVDMPMLVFSSLFLLFALYDHKLSMAESILFLFALAIFLVHSLSGDDEDKIERTTVHGKDILFFILGGFGVYIGAKFTIEALIKMAEALNIGSEMIAVSLVALGTSLPEVVVSITAAKRGQPDIAIGNVLGSNIFNTYAVMAIPSFIGPLSIPSTIVDFNLPLMVGVTLFFAFICISKQISRWEGFLLLLLYFYFLINLITQV